MQLKDIDDLLEYQSNPEIVRYIPWPPRTIEQVKRVADNQMNMPPKSTWVEPKLRSGLTIYHINE